MDEAQAVQDAKVRISAWLAAAFQQHMLKFCGGMGSDYLKLGVTLTSLAKHIQCGLVIELQCTATPNFILSYFYKILNDINL